MALRASYLSGVRKELKYSEKQRIKIPKNFSETYNAAVHKIDRSNFWKFVELHV